MTDESIEASSVIFSFSKRTVNLSIEGKICYNRKRNIQKGEAYVCQDQRSLAKSKIATDLR